jgi:hypothetical protein
VATTSSPVRCRTARSQPSCRADWRTGCSRAQWQGPRSLVFRLTPPQTVASWHDKPTYSKSRVKHRKLCDAEVSEYRAATASAPTEAPSGHATPIGHAQAGKVAEGRQY